MNAHWFRRTPRQGIVSESYLPTNGASPFGTEVANSGAEGRSMPVSGTRSNATGGSCGRSSPLLSGSRRSRNRMRVVLIPTNAAVRELRPARDRPSNRTVTYGIPSITFEDWTLPGHHFPLPKRTSQIHTGLPGKSSTTAVGSISYLSALLRGLSAETRLLTTQVPLLWPRAPPRFRAEDRTSAG